MGERSKGLVPEGEQLLEGVKQILESSAFHRAFSGASQEERLSFLVFLEENLKKAKKDNATLSEFEREARMQTLAREFGIIIGKRYTVEQVVTKSFRRGQFLDFSGVNERMESLLPNNVNEYIKICRDHIQTFGRDSIVHLCLGRWEMGAFIEGVSMGTGFITEVANVNTIDQLRQILDVRQPLLRRNSGFQISKQAVKGRLREWDLLGGEDRSS